MRKPPADAGRTDTAAYGAGPRVEPWLDPNAAVGGEPMPPPPPARAPAKPTVPAWHRWVAALLAVGGVALLLWLREPLSERLWPDTRAQQLRADAAQALQAGQLTRADGRGARELYEAALALDPDRPDAREGLARVGQAALAQAGAAIRAGRHAEAHRALRLARELAVPRAQTDALAQRLRERESSAAGFGALLAQAEAARADGRLDGAPDSALPLYGRVLALQPNHTRALEGREDTLADLLQLARQALARDALGEANALVRRVQAVDPGHVNLPDALAALADASARQLRRADADLRRGRLPQALVKYRTVAELDPDNAAAARGRVAVANAYAARSERHAADFRFAEAQAALAEAQAIAPDAPEVAVARQHLSRARQSHARLESPVPPGQRQHRLRQLLADAAAAEARGDLLLPPGESAYDKLRAAHALAPRDPAVARAMQRLAPAAQECFQRNLRANGLAKAGVCLDAWQILSSDVAVLAQARRRLALRWVAYGNERLGAYELDAVQSALSNAREIDPAAPGIDDLAGRLARAARN